MARINTKIAGIVLAGGSVLCGLGIPLVAQNVPDDTNASKMVNRMNSGMSSAWSAADMHFASAAATGGMLEVELGHIALKNASNDRVKEFAQRMIDDHSKINEQLKAVAGKYNMTLPTMLEPKQQAMLDRLSGMNGRPFNDQYITDMVQVHQNDAEAFQKETTEGTNGDLKDFAASTLPTIQEHLRLARSIQDALTAEADRNQWRK